MEMKFMIFDLWNINININIIFSMDQSDVLLEENVLLMNILPGLPLKIIYILKEKKIEWIRMNQDESIG